MGGTKPAGPAGQPEAEAAAPLRLAVVMDRPADASRICRVDAPDRVLRIWAMLSNADGELHQASLRPEMTARLQRQLDALTAELERSLSPALAGDCTASSTGSMTPSSRRTNCASSTRPYWPGPLAW